MIEQTIKELTEAVKQLTESLKAVSTSPTVSLTSLEMPEPAPSAGAEEKATGKAKAKPKPTSEPEPAPPVPEEPQQAQPQPAAEPDPNAAAPDWENVYQIEDLRRMGKELIDAKQAAVLQKQLKEWGYKNLSSVPEEDFTKVGQWLIKTLDGLK